MMQSVSPVVEFLVSRRAPNTDKGWFTLIFELNPNIRIRELVPDDEPGALAVFSACNDYFEAATGTPSAPGDVQSLFYAIPEGAEPEQKRVLVVMRDARLIGVIDIVIRYPHRSACAVGLFLLHPDQRRQGLGSSIARMLLSQARKNGITQVTATTPVGWPAGRAFLENLGFAIGPPARQERPI